MVGRDKDGRVEDGRVEDGGGPGRAVNNTGRLDLDGKDERLRLPLGCPSLVGRAEFVFIQIRWLGPCETPLHKPTDALQIVKYKMAVPIFMERNASTALKMACGGLVTAGCARRLFSFPENAEWAGRTGKPQTG